VGAALPLFADENLKPPAQVASTEHFDFAPGGTVRITGSYGELYVESWDQPQVELTVTKSLPYDYDSTHPERSAQRLEGIRVVAKRPSPAELEISTALPHRHSFFSSPLSATTKGGVMLEYEIHVPRDARLVIHHGVGLVSVRDVIGDIEATCHRGDILLWLPSSGAYSIDAKNKFGKVSSDFAGASLSQLLVGQKFTDVNSRASQRLYLRTGFGGITLKPILQESKAKPPSPGSGR
jgi:hypothetical protein